MYLAVQGSRHCIVLAWQCAHHVKPDIKFCMDMNQSRCTPWNSVVLYHHHGLFCLNLKHLSYTAIKNIMCWTKWSILLVMRAYLDFHSMKRLWVSPHLPQDGILVHHRISPALNSSVPVLFVHLGGERHNTTSPARAQAQTAWSRVECTNLEATMPPTKKSNA